MVLDVLKKNVSAAITMPKLDLGFGHTLEESHLMFYSLHFRSLPSDVFGTFRGLGDGQSHWSPLVTLEPSGVYGHLRILSEGS